MTTAPLSGAVRARVVGLAADALGRMDAQQLPASLRRVASFAPTRRARLAATQIAGVLAEAGVPERGVAVAVDGEVVRRADWPEHRLTEGTRVEVLTAVQGG